MIEGEGLWVGLEMEKEDKRKMEECGNKEGHIWRLTRGLCHSRDQLVAFLTHSQYRYVQCACEDCMLQ